MAVITKHTRPFVRLIDFSPLQIYYKYTPENTRHRWHTVSAMHLARKIKHNGTTTRGAYNEMG